MKYIDKIKEISKIGLPVLLSETQVQLKNKEESSIKAIESNNLIKVTISGHFNAGKTSLINALVEQHRLLPVDTIPTTSIPCEIYPAVDENNQYAQIFRDGDCVYEGSLEGYGKFKVIPGDVGKAYIRSKFISSCYSRGIVLVDMPGSDSGIREHNDAILRYVNEGAAFACVVSVTNGSLSSSEMAFIKEIKEYGLPCALFLSKTDLRSAEQVSSIVELCTEQFNTYMEQDNYVGTVCSNNSDVNAFCHWIESIETDKINDQRFSPIVKSYLEAVRSAIVDYRNIIIGNGDTADIDAKIKELEEEIKTVYKLLDEALANADTPEKSTQDIVDQVGNDMHANSRLVAQAIMTGNTIQVNETIMSVIRPSLLKAFAQEREQFVNVMKTELDAVTSRLLGNIEISQDVIDGMITNNSDTIISGIQLLSDRLIGSGNYWAVIAGQFLKLIAEYIPGLIRKAMGAQERAIKKIEQKFVGPFTQQILSSLYPIVKEQVKLQQMHILERVRQQFGLKIAQLQEALNHLKDRKKDIGMDIAIQVEKLDNALAQLSGL